jgi:uncharacterized protein
LLDDKIAMTLEYWYMLPLSVLVATVAMASGVGGATFFAPILLLGLRLPPDIAIGVGLITQLFGFASGLLAYMRRQLVDYHLGLTLLVVTVPAALVGTWAAGYIDPIALKIILSVTLFLIATTFLRSPRLQSAASLEAVVQQVPDEWLQGTDLNTRAPEQVSSVAFRRTEGRLITGVGALFLGLVATGLGELSCYFFLQRCHLPSKVAVATTVFLVALTSLPASAAHFLRFSRAGEDVLPTVLSLVLFTIPGVLIGGQLGPAVASRIPQRALERSLGILFMVVAGLTLWRLNPF